MQFMKSLVLVGALLSALGTAAAADQANQASVEQLLEAMHSKQIFEQTVAQFKQMQAQAKQQQLAYAHQGKPSPELDPKVQQLIDQHQQKVEQVVMQQLSWDSMRPVMVKIYSDVYSEAEVQDLLKFYQSPTGQKLLKKQPEMAKQMMLTMQERTSKVQQLLVQMNQQLQSQLKPQ